MEQITEIEGNVEKRKEKILEWIKKPQNLLFVFIIASALLIRLYYFILTNNQPIWWDEGEYIGMARAWAFGLEYNFLPVRPIFFSLITAVFLKIANTEFLPKMFLLLSSLAVVIVTYYFGKEIYNKKIGLIASFLMAPFYLIIFYSTRFFPDIPALVVYILATMFFYKYTKIRKAKYLYMTAILVALATLFKISFASFLFAAFIFVLITEKLSFLKKKEYWISVIIFFLVLSPYLIWGYGQFGGNVITLAGAWNKPKEGIFFSNLFTNLKDYFNFFPNILVLPLLIAFILGLFLFYELILGFDILIKRIKPKQKKQLYLLLLFLVPIITVSASVSSYGYVEERYILSSMPAIFVIAAVPILKIYNFLRKKKEILAILFLIILLGSIGYMQLKKTDSLTRGKKDSYMQVKQAGLWIKENSQPGDVIVTKSWPQIQVYSEREAIRLPNTKEEYEELIASNPDITLLMISIYEPHQDWAYLYPQENELTVIKAYFSDTQNTQPSLIIYGLD